MTAVPCVARFISRQSAILSIFMSRCRSDLGARAYLLARRGAKRRLKPFVQRRCGRKRAARICLFRNGGVLVGTLAYQCYALTLGYVLPAAVLATDDADLAAAQVALKADTGLDMLSILKDADPSFGMLTGLDAKAPPARFRAANGYVVDLVTPTRHRDEKQPVRLKELGAGEMNLQYLAWLIENAIPGLLPWGSGVPVSISRPERFAVHKLILAQKRGHDQAKVQKDLAQAKALIEAIEESRPGQVEDALEEACGQGKKGCRDPIARSIKQLWPDGEWSVS